MEDDEREDTDHGDEGLRIDQECHSRSSADHAERDPEARSTYTSARSSWSTS